jgi:hypothetical protein
MARKRPWVIVVGMSTAAWVTGLLCLRATPCLSAAERPSSPQAASPPRLALLVGVQTYPKLGPQRQLDGCRNDVRLMKDLLVDRFGFRPEEIVTLVDDQATAASIRNELERLLKDVGHLSAEHQAAQVVFYFSGHGSQVRDQEEGDPDCDEQDGLDETLVPYDADREGSDQDIRDDELYRFVEALSNDGRNRLWIVLDCCHSGTGVRGTTKIRRLDRNVAPLAPGSGASRKITPKRLPDGAVLLSACRACEVEPEYREAGESYGLLTRFLTQVLQETPAISTLSYRSLREMIVGRYECGAVVPAPTPQLEGSSEALGSVVLGAGSQSDRAPCWKVEPLGRDRRAVRLAAGAFHGVTVGSLYELYQHPEKIVWHPDRSPDDAKETSLAWLEIEQVEAAAATARVFQWADRQRRARIDVALPRDFNEGYAVKRYHQHAQLGARIRVVRAIDAEADGPPLGPADPAVPIAIRDALGSIQDRGESAWLAWVEGDQPCDLLVRIDGHYAALFPASGMPATSPRGPADRGDAVAVRGDAVGASLRGGWGPIDLDDPAEASRQLKTYLRRIVRARNLIRVASTQAASRGAAQIELQLLAVQLNRDLEIEGKRPWPVDSEQSLVIGKDDLFALEVRHRQTSAKPMYVTVLAVDPDMEIQTVLPHQQGIGLFDEQRLEPGGTRVSSPYQCTEPYGPHWAIVLATDEPNDFSMLAQPRLPRIRSTIASSPLEELLLEQTYFRTRGSRRPRPQKSADSSWSAAVLRWEAVP